MSPPNLRLLCSVEARVLSDAAWPNFAMAFSSSVVAPSAIIRLVSLPEDGVGVSGSGRIACLVVDIFSQFLSSVAVFHRVPGLRALGETMALWDEPAGMVLIMSPSGAEACSGSGSHCKSSRQCSGFNQHGPADFMIVQLQKFWNYAVMQVQ